MGNLAKKIQHLRQKLNDVTDHKAGNLRVLVELSENEQIFMPDWLAAQPLFPQFYWCHRDKHEQVAACGSVEIFHGIEQAQSFIQQSNNESMRLWGLNSFIYTTSAGEYKNDSYFFLPRIELIFREQCIYLVVNLYSENSLVEDAKIAVDELARLQTVVTPLTMLSKIVSIQHQPEQLQWHKMVMKALTEIEAGQFEKVVLARRSLIELNKPLRPIELISASQKVNHHCFHFMLAFNEYQGFLGSTPERLFHRCGKQLTTEAIAGTVAGSDNDKKAKMLADWLMADKKNQNENLLVVKDIEQRLNGAVLKLIIDEPKVIRLRKVQHLYRKITAQLIEDNDVDCVQRLQPTAAVAGLPRREAISFILKNEPEKRGWYAGTAGYLSVNESELVVTLRSALIEQSQLYLYAGAGIVTGSDPQHEWTEVENKAAGLKVLLPFVEV